MDSIVKLSFEDALSELDSLVRCFEDGDLSLEKAMKAYERGIALRVHCEKKLKDARMRVEQLLQEEGGMISSNVFNA